MTSLLIYAYRARVDTLYWIHNVRRARACDLYNAAALMSLSDANIFDLFIRQLLPAAVCASPPCPLSPPVIVYSNACACDEDGVV